MNRELTTEERVYLIKESMLGVSLIDLSLKLRCSSSYLQSYLVRYEELKSKPYSLSTLNRLRSQCRKLAKSKLDVYTIAIKLDTHHTIIEKLLNIEPMKNKKVQQTIVVKPVEVIPEIPVQKDDSELLQLFKEAINSTNKTTIFVLNR